MPRDSEDEGAPYFTAGKLAQRAKSALNLAAGAGGNEWKGGPSKTDSRPSSMLFGQLSWSACGVPGLSYKQQCACSLIARLPVPLGFGPEPTPSDLSTCCLILQDATRATCQGCGEEQVLLGVPGS